MELSELDVVPDSQFKHQHCAHLLDHESLVIARIVIMDIDEDDDLYVPEEPKVETTEEKKPKFDDLEEGEEEDEGAAMDEDDDDSVRCASL